MDRCICLIYRLTVLAISVQRMLFQFRVNQGENENLTGLYYLYTATLLFSCCDQQSVLIRHIHKHVHIKHTRQNKVKHLLHAHAIYCITERISYNTPAIVYTFHGITVLWKRCILKMFLFCLFLSCAKKNSPGFSFVAMHFSDKPASFEMADFA